MRQPTSLKECIDVALKAELSVNEVISACNLEFPEFEIEGAIAERLSQAQSPLEVIDIGCIAPNPASLKRAFSRASDEIHNVGISPLEIRVMEKALKLLETIKLAYIAYPVNDEERKARIRLRISQA